MASDFRVCRPSLLGFLCCASRTAWPLWKPHRGCVEAMQAPAGPGHAAAVGVQIDAAAVGVLIDAAVAV